MSLNYSVPEFNYAGFEQSKTRFKELSLEAISARRNRRLSRETRRTFARIASQLFH